MYSYSAAIPVVFENSITGTIHPNPSNGNFQLTFQASAGEKILAKTYDVQGREIKHAETTATGYLQKFSIDLSDGRYPAGVYMLQVRMGSIVKVYKAIKQ